MLKYYCQDISFYISYSYKNSFYYSFHKSQYVSNIKYYFLQNTALGCLLLTLINQIVANIAVAKYIHYLVLFSTRDNPC